MADQSPVPRSILRGHKAQVHAAVFIRGNKRLVTGDAEGFVIVWDLTILRARAVWKAHQKAILGIREWGTDKIITHGRDNEIIVWRLTEDGETTLEKSLPVQGVSESHPKPWIQHVLPVNSMNFCAFAACERGNLDLGTVANLEPAACDLLVAAPNALTLEAVDIFGLPSQHRLFTVKPAGANGMSMALAMFQLKGSLHLVAAYESGMATVSRLYLAMGTWATVYRHQAHTQPVLSLDLSPSLDFFISSSADAVIAKHPIPAPCPPAEPSTLDDNSLGDSKSAPATVTTPLKVVNTKHAGQQGLQIRSDGTIFATAGWDSRIRVYSAKTMKEVAVLKWHTVSCFATAFSSMTVKPEDPSLESNIAQASQDGRAGGNSTQLASSSKVDLTVQERRIRHAETAHWLAAGSKDGKVSLWDIY